MVGTNTAQSTSTMATSAVDTSSIDRRAASRGRQALLEIALDILDDDDRVIDDDADRQHQPEHRQSIERIAEGGEHGEGADQRDRNGDDRDDRRAPALQEDEDDQNDQRDRFEQGDLHRFHRLADELGRVPDDAIGDARREVLRRGLHLADHALGGGERIGARPLGDAEDQRFLARQDSR